MTKTRKLLIKIMPLLFATLMFMSCNQTEDVSRNNSGPADVNLRAIGAAAKFADGDSTVINDCGCYAFFDNIDWENLTENEIDAKIDAALASLSDQELSYLFDPVCTESGEIYESACIAECEGVTNYRACTDEELEDYLWEDFDCDDEEWQFPMNIELPDGTTLTVNDEDELWDLLDEWYDDNGDEYEEEECFDLVFPVSVNFPGGEVQSFDDYETLDQAVFDWYENNYDDLDSLEIEDDSLDVDFENEPDFVYPIQIVLDNGEQQTINNSSEFEAIADDCDEFEDWDDYEDDYEDEDDMDEQ